jgi:hypothetical protein
MIIHYSCCVRAAVSTPHILSQNQTNRLMPMQLQPFSPDQRRLLMKPLTGEQRRIICSDADFSRLAIFHHVFLILKFTKRDNYFKK